MSANTSSLSKSPQAVDDFYDWTENTLLLSYLFCQPTNVVTLTVMSNDLGGAAKTLWSIDNGDFLSDLLDSTVSTAWEATASGNQIRIYNGQIELDISGRLIALTGVDDVNALAAGATLTDSFTYAIRLGNGALSAATVTFTLVGDNDAASISGASTGTVTEDSNAPMTFAAPVAVGTGGTYTAPIGLYLADVNGDGKVDLVAANYVEGQVGVLLGDGVGGFGPPTTYGVGAQPAEATLADLDGDGALDIVTTNPPSDTISVLLNDGTGVFGAAVSYGVAGAVPSSVAATDVNGDGMIDLVVTVTDSHQLSVFLNLGGGNGTFGPATTYAASVVRPVDLVLADVSGDGTSDIITSGIDSNDVAVLLGTGSGFGAASTYATGGSYSQGVAVGDLNGDGNLDVVTSNYHSDNVSVLLGNGSGGFSAPALFAVGTGLATGPTDLALADMNGDSNTDIVTANPVAKSVSILLGDGNGGFSSPTVIGVSGVPASVSLVDMNGDGKSDIITGNLDGGVLMLFNNSGTSGSPYASGILSVTDVDAGESVFAPVASAALNGIYGNFTFNEASGEWTYTLNNSDPQTEALGAGAEAHDYLTVSSFDGTASQIIGVKILGVNDFIV